jgi:hypothetical protein
MALPRLLLAWAAIGVLFAAWHEIRRRLANGIQPLGRALPSLALEALLLTLFAGLWFASLGSGGWVTLFIVVGGLVELPVRLRDRALGDIPWPEVLGGVVRVLCAGGLAAFLLT